MEQFSLFNKSVMPSSATASLKDIEPSLPSSFLTPEGPPNAARVTYENGVNMARLVSDKAGPSAQHQQQLPDLSHRSFSEDPLSLAKSHDAKLQAPPPSTTSHPAVPTQLDSTYDLARAINALSLTRPEDAEALLGFLHSTHLGLPHPAAGPPRALHASQPPTNPTSGKASASVSLSAADFDEEDEEEDGEEDGEGEGGPEALLPLANHSLLGPLGPATSGPMTRPLGGGDPMPGFVVERESQSKKRRRRRNRKKAADDIYARILRGFPTTTLRTTAMSDPLALVAPNALALQRLSGLLPPHPPALPLQANGVPLPPLYPHSALNPALLNALGSPQMSGMSPALGPNNGLLGVSDPSTLLLLQAQAQAHAQAQAQAILGQQALLQGTGAGSLGGLHPYANPSAYSTGGVGGPLGAGFLGAAGTPPFAALHNHPFAGNPYLQQAAAGPAQAAGGAAGGAGAAPALPPSQVPLGIMGPGQAPVQSRIRQLPY